MRHVTSEVSDLSRRLTKKEVTFCSRALLLIEFHLFLITLSSSAIIFGTHYQHEALTNIFVSLVDFC